MRLKQAALLIPFLSFLFACVKDCPDPTDTSKNIHLSNGLVAYYSFNGNVNDESGNNNNGSLIYGSALTHDENGRPRSALNLDGYGKKMVVQNNGKIKFDTAMTVSFHVMSRVNNRSNLTGMTDDATGEGTSFVIGPALVGNDNLIYSITNNDVNCDAIQNSTQVSNIDAGLSMQPESWYHVLCSYNKGTMKLYINGTLTSTRDSKDKMMHTCPNAQLLIGGWWSGDPAASLNGKIDEVRLYNRELNADEITELAKSFL